MAKPEAPIQQKSTPYIRELDWGFVYNSTWVERKREKKRVTIYIYQRVAKLVAAMLASHTQHEYRIDAHQKNEFTHRDDAWLKLESIPVLCRPFTVAFTVTCRSSQQCSS